MNVKVTLLYFVTFISITLAHLYAKCPYVKNFDSAGCSCDMYVGENSIWVSIYTLILFFLVFCSIETIRVSAGKYIDFTLTLILCVLFFSCKM